MLWNNIIFFPNRQVACLRTTGRIRLVAAGDSVAADPLIARSSGGLDDHFLDRDLFWFFGPQQIGVNRMPTVQDVSLRLSLHLCFLRGLLPLKALRMVCLHPQDFRPVFLWLVVLHFWEGNEHGHTGQTNLFDASRPKIDWSPAHLIPGFLCPGGICIS